MTAVTTSSPVRRIELILRQIDSLPTLPAIATRLLMLTASDESQGHEVIELVAADQALTAKVLGICRHADMGLRDDVMTVDRAVVLLGFAAIRNAVLSIKVFEMFSEPRDVAADPFDRVGFWRHCLAVGVAAQMIAEKHPNCRDLPPDEAFVCGLLHDIGKLALDHVLPKSFARVIELSDINQGNIAEFERRVVGLDHHTAGKRLAEQWQLPHRLQDCIWLHGSPYATLPRLEHRRMVGLIGLADLVVRRSHIGFSGNHHITQDPKALAQELGLDPKTIDAVAARLHEELEQRSRILGLDERPSRELYLRSINQANQALGRLNSALERRSRLTAKQGQALESITAFHAAASPGRSVQDVLNGVADSAASAFGAGYFALLYQPGDGEPWQFYQYPNGGSAARTHVLEPPPHAPNLAALDPNQAVSMNLMGILPWIADYLLESQDVRQVRLLPLASGWGTAAVMLHDRTQLPPWRELQSLCSTWGAAIAGAGQHDGARRLGEELAEANRALAETQDRLLQTQSMARLGEMAAGAAHEMNNPLAVIAGRSQLLATSLAKDTKEQKAAATIAEQAQRLSDLITSLRLLAEQPLPQRTPADVNAMIADAIATVGSQSKDQTPPAPAVEFSPGELPTVALDAQQIGQALVELLRNASSAQPRTGVRVSALIEPMERVLLIRVEDDGQGMDAHTLAHAKDPFFSAKSAGRRVGLGLTRAQQFAAAHGGRIDLSSSPGAGTVATLSIPLESGA